MRPAHLNLDVGAHSRPVYQHPKSPNTPGDPFSFFNSPGYLSHQWQTFGVQIHDDTPIHGGLLLNHDGLSPLLVSSDLETHEVYYQREREQYQRESQPASSPRLRPVFLRINTGTGISDPTTPLSPTLSDSGLASPSLPVISPHASERSKRLSRRKRTTLAAVTPSCLNTQASWLILYFAFNLGLTLYNKFVLVQFPFPYTLTALHALCGSIGGWILQLRGVYVPTSLTSRQHGALASFSVLYAVNIAVSNVSLQMVTIPFHQVVRAATPIFTTVLSMIMFNARFSTLKIASLLPVMAGVALATYGDYYFTWWGLLLTLLGTFLAALKTIYTNVLQSTPPLTSASNHKVIHLLPVPPRMSLHPLDLLTRTSPLACVLCMLYAYSSGELSRARQSFAPSGVVEWSHVLVLLGNGVIAFGLNVISLSANKRVGALNMTVAANVKQALTILCAVALFHLTITPMNAFGICVTLAGGAWYAWVEYCDKMQRKRAPEKHKLTGSGRAK
ncbi:uncharacterized protein FIBRA_07837 [Fibroporia radiculosa]|uniref:Sugar phosphate transporter domain-containing protein n=1 Tax=Fibroporia radiculosa TaxID=599839 RepID=J4GFP3_9APHY|nr:uncharacterized protein FIBRA_07837 [Fibroporia radiculosa]CCM05608.1 predicted protein [Fibroporia radiculosa]